MKIFNLYLIPAILFSILTIVVGIGVASVITEFFAWFVPTMIIGASPVFYWIMYFKEIRVKKGSQVR